MEDMAMLIDPKEFKDRFARWKEGKPVYDKGRPINKTFSDDEAIDYIIALENPGKVGWDKSKKIWRTPRGKGYDNNQIAYGLDIRLEHNPLVYNYLKDNNRLDDPWLTDQEAKSLAMQTYRQKKDTVNKAIQLAGGNVSQRGYNILSGMAWHGHPMKSILNPDSITGKAFRNAIRQGDQDFDQVFDTYYYYGSNANRFAERIKADKAFRPKAHPETYVLDNGTKVMQSNKPDWAKGEKRIELKMPEKPITIDYSLNQNIPELLNPFNNADSPAYKARIKGIQEINGKNQREMWDLFNNNAVAYGSKPLLSSVKDLISKGKEDFVRSVMGTSSIYDDYAPTYNKLQISGSYKCGKNLPKYDTGDDNYRYIQTEDGWTRVSDNDTSRTFEGITATPRGNKYKFVPKIDNSQKAIAERDKYSIPRIGSAPIEPGLELTFPEFDLLTLVGGIGNLGVNTTKQAQRLFGSPSLYKDIAKEQYYKNLVRDFFSRKGQAERALSSRRPKEDISGLLKYYTDNKFYGTDYDELPENIYNIIKQSSYDRLRAKRPWITDKEFDSMFEQSIKGGFSEYPEETFIVAGRENSAGSQFPDNGHIAIRNGYVDYALPHEVRHRMQQMFPHTQEEEELLEPVFGSWWRGLQEKYPELKKITSDLDSEIDTGILDFRKRLVGNSNLERMTPSQQNNFMSNTSIVQRREAAKNANGYMRKGYEDKLSISQEAADEWVNQLVNIAQQLGAYSIPVVGSAALYNAMQDSGILPTQTLTEGLNNYNNGKIYIKPSKRGTFTAAAKKHGQSVQGFASKVLANPGNYSPAMVKKARFARNSKKWHH